MLFFFLVTVRLGVEKALADVLATPLYHNVDLGIEVYEGQEWDHP